jgi:hypothetical protein
MPTDPWSFLSEPSLTGQPVPAPRPAEPIPVAALANPADPTRPVPRRRSSAFSWIPRGIATIRGNPEDEIDEAILSKKNAASFLGSSVFHAIVLLIFVLAFIFVPREPAPLMIEGSIGSQFGVETGLEMDGGFDDSLLVDQAVDPTELSPDQLLEPVDPVIRLEPSPFRSEREQEAPGNGAGGGAEFGVARFGNGLAEKIQGVEVKVGDPQFTLIWDTQADMDIHVFEPGGSEIFWDKPHGKMGGELDVDDTDGLGPENVYWVVDQTEEGNPVIGRGPAGKYQWYVNYYGGHGGAAGPTKWKVRVKHGEQVEVFEGTLRRIGARSRMYTFEMPSPGGGPLRTYGRSGD